MEQESDASYDSCWWKRKGKRGREGEAIPIKIAKKVGGTEATLMTAMAVELERAESIIITGTQSAIHESPARLRSYHGSWQTER